jgi:hypothetical protein
MLNRKTDFEPVSQFVAQAVGSLLDGILMAHHQKLVSAAGFFLSQGCALQN